MKCQVGQVSLVGCRCWLSSVLVTVFPLFNPPNHLKRRVLLSLLLRENTAQSGSVICLSSLRQEEAVLVFLTLTHVGPLIARICTTNTLLSSNLQYLKMNSKKVRVSPRSNLGGSVSHHIFEPGTVQPTVTTNTWIFEAPWELHACARPWDWELRSRSSRLPPAPRLSKVTWLVGAGGGGVTGCARAGPASNIFRHLLARGSTRLQLPSNRQPP